MKGRTLIWAVVLLLADSLIRLVPAMAHHPSGAATPVDSAAFTDPLTGGLGGARSRVGVFSRYLRLTRIPPTYNDPVPQAPSHLFFSDLRASVVLLDRLAISAAAPVVVNAPDDADTETGLGDLRFGLQGVVWRQPSVGSLSGLLELSTPTGQVVDGLGAGVFVGRAALMYVHQLFDDWQLTAQAGAAWAFEADSNVVVDYGGGLRWSPFEWIGLFVDVRAGTYTRTNDGRLSALQRQPRDAGNTAVTVTPGVVARPLRDLFVTVAPQIPATTIKDFDHGLTLSIQYRL